MNIARSFKNTRSLGGTIVFNFPNPKSSMNEGTTKKISVLVAIIGLVLLYYVSANIQPVRADISTITAEDIGSTVLVCGNITTHREKDGHIFMDISDETGKIRLVVFSSYIGKVQDKGLGYSNFTAGRSICATGAVDEYPKGSGSLEIVYRGGEINVH